jgi:hypothetical protein
MNCRSTPGKRDWAASLALFIGHSLLLEIVSIEHSLLFLEISIDYSLLIAVSWGGEGLMTLCVGMVVDRLSVSREAAKFTREFPFACPVCAEWGDAMRFVNP